MTMVVRMATRTSAVSQGAARKIQARSIGARLKRWLMIFKAWKAERAAVVRLQSMSDRELKDIGISRSEVGSVARAGNAHRVMYIHYC